MSIPVVKVSMSELEGKTTRRQSRRRPRNGRLAEAPSQQVDSSIPKNEQPRNGRPRVRIEQAVVESSIPKNEPSVPSNRNPMVDSLNQDRRKIKYVYVNMDDSQRAHASRLFGRPVESSERAENNSHPIANFERHEAGQRAMALACRLADGAWVLDVGGNPDRQYSNGMVHSCNPVIEGEDLCRQVLRSNSSCRHRGQDCDCHVYGALLLVHVHYYISPDDLLGMMDRCGGRAIVVCYNFPYLWGKLSFGEMTYTRKGDDVLCASPDRVYSHSAGNYAFDGYYDPASGRGFSSTINSRFGSQYIITLVSYRGEQLKQHPTILDQTTVDFTGPRQWNQCDMLLDVPREAHPDECSWWKAFTSWIYGVPVLVTESVPFNRRLFNILVAKSGFRERDAKLLQSINAVVSSQIQTIGTEYQPWQVRGIALAAVAQDTTKTKDALTVWDRSVQDYNLGLNSIGRPVGYVAMLWTKLKAWWDKGVLSRLSSLVISPFYVAGVGIVCTFSFAKRAVLRLLGYGSDVVDHLTNPRVVVRGICREGMVVDPAGDFKITVTHDVNPCQPKIEAVLDGVGIENKLPVLPARCQHNEIIAVQTRLDRKRPHPVDPVVQAAIAAEVTRILHDFADYLTVHPIEVDVEKWVKSRPYTDAVKKKIMDAYTEALTLDEKQMEDECISKAFVKMEAYSKLAFRPRMINGKSYTYAVVTCPYTQAATERFVEFTQQYPFSSGCGKTAVELGESVAQLMLGIPDPVFIETDFTAFETSVTGVIREEIVKFHIQTVAQMEIECAAQAVIAFQSQLQTRGRTTNGVLYESEKSMTESGTGNTTFDNEVTNLAVHMYLSRRYVEETKEEPLVRGVLKGDDNLACGNREYAVWHATIGEQIMHSGGFTPKTFLHDEIESAVFCSGRVMANFGSYVWVPKIGRYLYKTFYRPQYLFSGKPVGYYSKTVVSSMVAFREFPIISALYTTIMRLGPNLKKDNETIIATKEDIYKIRNPTVIRFDRKAAVDFICTVYGCPEHAVTDLEEFIENQKVLPFVIPYRLVSWFYEKDVEDDEECQVGNFVDSEAAFRENLLL